MSRAIAMAAAAAALSLLFVDSSRGADAGGRLALSPQALAYVHSKPRLMEMYRLGVDEDRKLGLEASCKSQYLVKPMATLMVSPIEFAEGKPDPVKGVWMTRYGLERCGDTKVYNALFIVKDGQPPTPTSFFPGSTNAGPVLVKDAMKTALTSAVAAGVPKDCKTAYVVDMRVTAPAHDVSEQGRTLKGVWDELWTFTLCGQLTDVPMTFIPDADGSGGTSFLGAKATVRSTPAQ